MKKKNKMLIKILTIVIVSPSTYIASYYLGYKSEIQIFDISVNFQLIWILGIFFSILSLFLPLKKFKKKISLLLCGIHILLGIVTIITAIQVYTSSNTVIFENGELIFKKINWEYSELEKIMPDLEKKIGIKMVPSEKKIEILSRSKNPEELHTELEKYKKTLIVLTQVLEDRKLFYLRLGINLGAIALLGLFIGPLIHRMLFGTAKSCAVEKVETEEEFKEGVFEEITKIANGEKVQTNYLYYVYNPFQRMSDEEIDNCLRKTPVERIPPPDIETIFRLSFSTWIMLQDMNVGTSLVERKLVIPDHIIRILFQDINAKRELPRGLYLEHMKINKNSYGTISNSSIMDDID